MWAGRAAPCGAFGTPEQLREDVWLILQRNIERHVSEAGSAWKRAAGRLAAELGRLACPFICSGYHARQGALMRKLLAALPA